MKLLLTILTAAAAVLLIAYCWGFAAALASTAVFVAGALVGGAYVEQRLIALWEEADDAEYPDGY